MSLFYNKGVKNGPKISLPVCRITFQDLLTEWKICPQSSQPANQSVKWLSVSSYRFGKKVSDKSSVRKVSGAGFLALIDHTTSSGASRQQLQLTFMTSPSTLKPSRGLIHKNNHKTAVLTCL